MESACRATGAADAVSWGRVDTSLCLSCGRAALLLGALAAWLPSCKKPAEADPPAPVLSVPPEPPPAPRPPPPPPSAREEVKKPLQMLKFAFTSGVKAKEAVDELTEAPAGKRVYAHMTFRNTNREARSVRVIFRVNGDRRTMLDLKVEPAQSYRTWAFNTLKETDRTGELTLEVTDEDGKHLYGDRLPIKATKGKLGGCCPTIHPSASRLQTPLIRGKSTSLGPSG